MVTQNLLKVGIIGLGKMGKLHMMNCLHVGDVKVAAVADPLTKNLKIAKSIGVKDLYNNYHDLLNESHKSLDAVVITLPNYLHFESIQLALEAGLNIFSEKPLANTANECRRIVQLVEKSDKKLMIGHNLRFLDAVIKIKDAVDKGLIGDLEALALEEVMNGPFSPHALPTPVPEWWFDPMKTGGGVLLDLGYHLFDLFRFFAGDFRVLYSFLDYKLNLPIEDSAIVIVRSQNSSVKGIINVGWYQNVIFPKYNFRLILNGTAGYVSSDDYVPSNIYLHAIKEGTKNLFRKVLGRKIRPLSYSYYYESYYKEINHFFDCIKNDSEPLISAIDGLKIVKLVEHAYKISNRRTIQN